MPILKKQNKKQIPVRKMATNKIMTYDTHTKKMESCSCSRIGWTLEKGADK